MKQPLIILTGPTAVGKTALSIQLAHKVGGEIISADSMQVYKRMDIGTAKVMPEEMEGIKHHLIDVLEPSDDFNVFRFQEMAKEEIVKILTNGHIPIIAGGTGFYIQSVLYDIEFEDSDADLDYRNELISLAQKNGNEYVHSLLMEVDKEAAESIHPNNLKRVIRALEYFKQTGSKISLHNEEQSANSSPYNFVYFVLNDDRAAIYERIDKRVDMMFEAGLIKEVESLMAEGLDESYTSMKGIGYKEVIAALKGEYSMEDAAYIIKRDTRHFAKRQLTWFRREKDVTMININEFSSREEILEYMINILKEKNII